MKIELGKKYLTRGGSVVRIVSVDRIGTSTPILGLSRYKTNDWESIVELTSDGEDLLTGDSDLVSEYVEPPKPREWVVQEHSLDLLTTSAHYVTTETSIDPLSKFIKVREVIE